MTTLAVETIKGEYAVCTLTKQVKNVLHLAYFRRTRRNKLRVAVDRVHLNDVISIRVLSDSKDAQTGLGIPDVVRSGVALIGKELNSE